MVCVYMSVRVRLWLLLLFDAFACVVRDVLCDVVCVCFCVLPVFA